MMISKTGRNFIHRMVALIFSVMILAFSFSLSTEAKADNVATTETTVEENEFTDEVDLYSNRPEEKSDVVGLVVLWAVVLTAAIGTYVFIVRKKD